MCLTSVKILQGRETFEVSSSTFKHVTGKAWNRLINMHVCPIRCAGQFWNVPITVADYTGRLGSLDPGDRTFYLTISPPSGNTRTFVGVLQERSWDKTRVPCIYVGNRQAGPIGDIPEDEVPNDSVIEGQYLSYIVSSKYANDCVFCQQFNSTMCAV